MSPLKDEIAQQSGRCAFRNFMRVCDPLVVLMIVAFSIVLARACPT